MRNPARFPLKEGLHSRQAHADLPEQAVYEREVGREGFFGVYLSDPAYTVADAAAPPVALIDAIIGSRPQSVASVSACLAIVAIAADKAENGQSKMGKGVCQTQREA